MGVTRRKFLSGAAGATAMGMIPETLRAVAAHCPFRLAVINDEISQDFERSCQIAAQDFGLQWIELRGMWNKNIVDLDANQVAESKRILARYKLRVTDIASPLYKVDWPGAPISKLGERRDQFNAKEDFDKQPAVLERCIELARDYGTERIRCFDFWRLDDQKPYRADMDEVLRKAAQKCQQHGLILLLENEMSCNTATAPEAARTLSAIGNSNFMLNWDPGNAAAAGEKTPYPDGYALLPKKRIGHCHCKDVVYKPDGKYAWAPVGGGVIDWTGQLRALARNGFHYGLSLETHWRGAGTPEASTRISMDGLKKTLAKAGITC